MNKVILIGNLGSDPEIKTLQSGTAVANLSVATTKYSKGQETTSWHKIILFGKAAENAAQQLHKGDKVAVDGELVYREWQDKEGKKQKATEIQSFNFVEIVARKGGSSQDEGRHSISTGAMTAPARRDSMDDIPF